MIKIAYLCGSYTAHLVAHLLQTNHNMYIHIHSLFITRALSVNNYIIAIGLYIASCIQL